jgi:hypothetical protein
MIYCKLFLWIAFIIVNLATIYYNRKTIKLLKKREEQLNGPPQEN